MNTQVVFGGFKQRSKQNMFLTKIELGPAKSKQKEPRGEQWSHRLIRVAYYKKKTQ